MFWVPAMSRESVELAYREIGIRLRIPGIADDNADVMKLVKEALSSDDGRDWLMIVDNADDAGVLTSGTGGDPKAARLYDYLPYGDRGKIVFTTRSRKAAEDLTQSSVLGLRDMGKAEARPLLALRLTNQTLLEDETAVDDLLDVLACLPLAIVQAAAFINNNDISVSQYVSLFRETGTEAELFGKRFEDPNRYHEMESTIARTWHISFDQIRRQDALAAEYLTFMACIDRINIPKSLLPPGGSLARQVEAIGTLKGYAFVTERQQQSQESGNERFFDVHRLVHMASVWWLEGHGEWSKWVGQTAARLEELVPYGGHEKRTIWAPYLPHAVHVAGLAGALDDVARGWLLERVGRCQSSLGQYFAAETTHRQVLSLREGCLGKDDESTLRSMNEVGVALEQQGRYPEAEKIHRRTLAAREEVLGANHPSTLGSMNNLALVLGEQGKSEEAEKMHRRTLAAMEEVLGANHPDTLTSMNNLALVLGRRGKNEEADKMHRRTLAAKEEVLGANHPSTLMSVWCLAHLLGKSQNTDESNALYEQACNGFAIVLGREHPTTRACQQDFLHTVSLQDQDVSVPDPSADSCRQSTHTGKTSRLSRGLAKLGIRKL